MTELNKNMIQYGVKSGLMAGTYVAIDKYLLKRTSTTKSIGVAFAAIVAGSLVAQVLADQFLMENTLLGLMPGGAKSIESQIAQVAGSVVAGSMLDKYLLKNSYSKDMIDYKSIAVLIVADLISEVAMDVIYQKQKIDPFD
jgi:hypothetical protein